MNGPLLPNKLNDKSLELKSARFLSNSLITSSCPYLKIRLVTSVFSEKNLVDLMHMYKDIFQGLHIHKSRAGTGCAWKPNQREGIVIFFPFVSLEIVKGLNQLQLANQMSGFNPYLSTCYGPDLKQYLLHFTFKN